MSKERIESHTMTIGLLNTRLTVLEKEVAGLKEIVVNHINKGVEADAKRD